MTSEAAVSSVVLVQTSSPDEDASVLHQLFPDVFLEESISSAGEDAYGESIVLVAKTLSVSIFLVASNSSSKSIWVTDEATIKAMESRDKWVYTHKQGKDCVQLTEVRLHSGASIFLTPPAITSSSIGRKLLGAALTGGSCSIVDAEVSNLAAQRNDGPAGDITPPIRRLFPSLEVGLLQQDGELQPNFPVNSQAGVDFETDLFKGRALVVLRPENPSSDPYWNERLFSKKKRRILIQLQGKFKHVPKGTVYAGAEVSEQMKLGLIARGLSTVLLKLVENFNPQVHFSYGDSKGREKPHIVVPAYSFFERVVVTPPGENPPLLGEQFVESAPSIAQRKKPNVQYQFTTSDVYSFSFYSMYMNLPTWQLVGLPVQGDISLKTFWGDSVLRICMYEKLGPQREHLQELNRYAFALQVKFLGDKSSEDGEDLFRMSGSRYVARGDSQDTTENTMNRSESQLFPIVTDEDTSVAEEQEGDDEEFFDAHQNHPSSESIPVPQKYHSSVELLSNIDAICPFFIDGIKIRGGYSREYAISWNGRFGFRSQKDCEELVDSTKAETIVDSTFSPRMSRAERLRRAVGCGLVNPTICLTKSNKLQGFMKTRSSLEGLFLKRAEPVLSDRERASILWSGYVARAVSDRHWIEEYVAVTCRNISFSHPEKRKANARVLVRSVGTVKDLPPELCPNVLGFYYLALETPGRSIYIMFSSENARKAFVHVVEALRAEVQEDACSSIASNISLWFEIDNPCDEFMHKSTMWNMKNRRLLNGGKYFFTVQEQGKNALTLVSDALRKAADCASETSDDYELRHAFLESAADLKVVQVRHLPEDFRLAFFLNLYHLMILHAFIVLGPPDSTFKWITYFNNIAYETSDDIFSLAELEHCIIRAKMSAPSQFLSRFVLPKSSYSFSLTKSDFRINFALNCGSKSNPSEALVYDVAKLPDQLATAARLYLRSASCSLRGPQEIVLQLPRICQWFFNDFGTSNEDLLHKIVPYLPDSIRRSLERFRTEDGRFDTDFISIRFEPYSFECRTFTVVWVLH